MARGVLRPHAGLLINGTAVYLATFAPAMLAHAGEPDFIVCARDGSGGGGYLTAGMSSLWYTQNGGLDADRDGRITVSDLTAVILRADIGPRWEAIVAAVAAAVAARDAMPEVMAPVEPALDVALSGAPEEAEG